MKADRRTLGSSPDASSLSSPSRPPTSPKESAASSPRKPSSRQLACRLALPCRARAEGWCGGSFVVLLPCCTRRAVDHHDGVAVAVARVDDVYPAVHTSSVDELHFHLLLHVFHMFGFDVSHSAGSTLACRSDGWLSSPASSSTCRSRVAPADPANAPVAAPSNHSRILLSLLVISSATPRCPRLFHSRASRLLRLTIVASPRAPGRMSSVFSLGTNRPWRAPSLARALVAFEAATASISRCPHRYLRRCPFRIGVASSALHPCRLCACLEVSFRVPSRAAGCSSGSPRRWPCRSPRA
jgi:hypothetical protein